jgi:hypothetical protein
MDLSDMEEQCDVLDCYKDTQEDSESMDFI